MRKRVFLALAGVFYLTGCESPSIEEIAPTPEVYPIQFSLEMEKEVAPFPATKSIPGNGIPEPSVPRAGEDEAELHELCSAIDYVVFKEGADGAFALAKHKQFTYDPTDLDADFGCIYDSLPQGNYAFYFIAHNSGIATLTGHALSFDELSDTFYKSYAKSIEVAEEVNQSISLERIVSRIEFMATDPVNSAIKKFDMEIEGRSAELDITTGAGIRAVGKETLSYTFTPDDLGKSGMSHSFLTFVPSTGNAINAHLSAIAQNDELIRERQVNGIVPEKNKVIRYKGRLYSRSESDDTFQISIYGNGEWEEKEEDLPEYE